jgi:hypothetical protein
MASSWYDDAALRAVILRRTGERPERVTVTERPLHGGLDSAGVTELSMRYLDDRGRPRLQRVIAKRLAAGATRELGIYERVVSRGAETLAPRLLHARQDDGGVTLFLEPVREERRWPWRDVGLLGLTLRSVAAFHATSLATVPLPEWNYEAELLERAAWAIESLERAGRELDALRGFLPAVRRVGEQLPHIRRELTSGPLPAAVIHGDLHPGNVVVRRSRVPGRRLALLDWGRARVGSPLEDVSSWLTSTGYWEPVARRRHDSLFGAYLAARGLDATPSRAVRDAYWLAGASNAFSGALLHHLEAARGAVDGLERERAILSTRDWLRVIRRADDVWSLRFDPAARGARGRRRSAASPAPRTTPRA